MSKQLSLAIIVIGAFSVGCSQEEISDVTTSQIADNAVLTALYAQDQADRKGDLPEGASRVERDRHRRKKVRAMLEAGAVRTATDYFHAAMILQHGNDTTHFKLAHKLAKKAFEMDSTNHMAQWLMAASWDRYLLTAGRPQWYGTQFVILDGVWYLRKIDTSQVSDQERQAYGVRTIAEIKRYLAEKNGTEKGSLAPPPGNITIIVE